MSLRLVSLASGSKGNATLIMSNTTAILVDAGISFTRISKELSDFGLTPSMLDAVVITHEHSDHTCGLPRLCTYTRVYAHPLTMQAMSARYELKNAVDIADYECGFKVGDIEVLPFRIPHDAAYPLAYSFCLDGARCSVATDIGVPTRGIIRNIKDSQVVLLEANHDLQMLKSGQYPQYLKDRILSDKGHLCNDATARIARLLCEDSMVKQLVLGHISENNNTEQLAYDTVHRTLEECDSDIELYVAHQSRRSEVFEIL